MEQTHEKGHHQWVVMEEEGQEVEEAALEGRQARKQLHDNGSSSVILSSSSSSSSSTSNGGTGHANGVSSLDSNPDGPLIQKDEQVAEMDNITENGNNHCNGEKFDNAAVGLGLVAEFAGAPTSGEAVSSNNTAITAASQNKNSVYFDKQEGKWKCHHCTWTKQFDSPWTMPTWDHEQNFDLLMNIKTMVQHGPCFICETKGYEANNGSYEVQNGDGARSVLPTNNGIGEFNIQVENSNIQRSPFNEVANQYMKTVEDKGLLNSELAPLHASSEIRATGVKHFNDETSAKAGLELMEKIDERLKELDVEAVLAKQETHDLFCPNCNSCITKRVILRKRKRSIRNLDTKSKPDKLPTIVRSEQADSSAREANQGDHANLTSDASSLEQQSPADNDPVQEQEVFRCLECFSIFIPRGNCFNLFWNFGGARENETSQITSNIPASNIQNPSSITVSNVKYSSNITVSNVQNLKQNPSDVPGSNENWFFSLFSSNKGKRAGEQGKSCSAQSKAGHAEQNHTSSIASAVLNSPENGHLDSPVTDTNIIDNGKAVPGIKPGHGGLNGNVKINVGQERNNLADIKNTDLPSKNFSGDIVLKHERDLLATAITSEALTNAGEPAKDATLKPHKREPDFLIQSHVDSRMPDKSQKDMDMTPENVQNGYSSLIMQEAQVTNDAATCIQNSGVDTKILSGNNLRLKEKVEIKPTVSNDNIGGDVIVDVGEDKDKSITSQTADTDPVTGATLAQTATQVGEQARAEIGEPRAWEILKSIVYGGLIESITSLGIVSSAAGSGAVPLNIIALGLANLIGGLFVIGHNLLELKNEKSTEDLQQTNTQDRYQELLGHRANFLLHAVVAVLSFLIFGSVPMVIYGILIRKNYQPEVKLAAITATSLLCTILLAIGKVYSKRPPKSYFKTVFYYFTLSLAASGVSYIAGGLIKDFLGKLSHSESGFVITIPSSGTGTMDPAWRSY